MAKIDPEIPEGHPWTEASGNDRIAFHCENCDVTVPGTAADPQAGIQLFCPECDEQMEMDWFYDE